MGIVKCGHCGKESHCSPCDNCMAIKLALEKKNKLAREGLKPSSLSLNNKEDENYVPLLRNIDGVQG